MQLYLPGCMSLTPDGVVNAVKTLTSNSSSLKRLKINGICNLDKEHLQTLKFYLEKNRRAPKESLEPAAIFFHNHANAKPIEDCGALSIDVEICPRCDQVRMVFCCPKETCRECRGCIFCIPRCAECGVCFDASEETEEVVCGDLLCSMCWVRLIPKCSFCNRPCCRQHWKRETVCTSGPDGFICGACDSEYAEDEAD